MDSECENASSNQEQGNCIEDTPPKLKNVKRSHSPRKEINTGNLDISAAKNCRAVSPRATSNYFKEEEEVESKFLMTDRDTPMFLRR